jgi:hypothetical protein
MHHLTPTRRGTRIVNIDPLRRFLVGIDRPRAEVTEGVEVDWIIRQETLGFYLDGLATGTLTSATH